MPFRGLELFAGPRWVRDEVLREEWDEMLRMEEGEMLVVGG